MAAPEFPAPGVVPVEPYIPARTVLPEFTARAVIIGTVLGMLFGASSLYLVLKVGLTVSASIPVAVIAVALFRTWSKVGGRDSTILENNIMQTAGSAGESLAFGIGVTMPAILILGFDLEIARVMLVAVLGGLLGILMMIPLRRAMIVHEHATLKYPEGTACAAVLKAGASAESRAAASESAQEEMRIAAEAGAGASPGARVILTGFFVGLIYKTVNIAGYCWRDVAGMTFKAPFKGGSVGIEVSPELLGVGYIIGPRIASIMCAGGVLAYLVLIPLIQFFGDALSVPVPPATGLIAEMTPGQIRSEYVLYIGAGAVAAGGIISVARALPMIWRGLRGGLRNFRGNAGGSEGLGAVRTDRDLSLKFVVGGTVVLLAAITLAPSLHMNLLGAGLIVVLGFLFVTVSSQLTGEVGSSSNPISGMTVATLLLTCLVFLVLGWTTPSYYVTALSVGAIVCIASSNGGTTSQDLKTGHLVGGTPKLQQYAILVGSLASALVLGPILLLLNERATVYVPAAQVAPALHVSAAELSGAKREGLTGSQAKSDRGIYRVWHNADATRGAEGRYLVDDSGRAVWLVDPGINGRHTKRPDGTEVRKFDAPKATLMSYIIKGILDRKLPWGLVLLGVFIAVAFEMAGMPSLAFAVGVYLPLSSSTPIFVGGMIRWLVDRRKRAALERSGLGEAQIVAETDKSPGVLLSSGYIAGGAIAGIGIAVLQGVPGPDRLDAWLAAWAENSNTFASGPFADAWPLLPFALITVFLLLVGRDRLLAPRKPGTGV